MDDINATHRMWLADPAGPSKRPGGNWDSLQTSIYVFARQSALVQRRNFTVLSDDHVEDAASNATISVTARLLGGHTIENLRGYVRRAVHNALEDQVRQLPTGDGDGEMDEGTEDEPLPTSNVANAALLPGPDAIYELTELNDCLSELHELIAYHGATNGRAERNAEVLLFLLFDDAGRPIGEGYDAYLAIHNILGRNAAQARLMHARTWFSHVLFPAFRRHHRRCAAVLEDRLATVVGSRQ